MVYQTTEGIDPRIRKSGCYFLSVLRIVEILTKTNYSVEDVNRVFKACERMGYIGANGYMKEHAGKGVAQICAGLHGDFCYLKRVFENEKHNFLIGKYHLNGGDHFILMPGPGVAQYDPWSPEGSNTVKNGKFHSPRYYWGEAI